MLKIPLRYKKKVKNELKSLKKNWKQPEFQIEQFSLKLSARFYRYIINSEI